MIEISIIELAFYTFSIFAFGAAIGVAVAIVYFENDIPRYVVTFEIGQQHVTLDLGDLLKDEINKTELEIMVSKEYYDAVDVGTIVNDEFRVGSLALKGSFGSWIIEVIDKRIEY